ncbi:MAG TPA: LPS export ABC transporter periplasmic protein LptC [Rhodospirillaceae bacterium]|nr:LPS export ABC transporter periplasmic protein LptC [Rhodospirillaceae bacterium]
MEEDHVASNWMQKKLGMQERRERLAQPPQERKNFSQNYSKFVRWMRLLLPLAALAIVAVLFTWNSTNDDIAIPVEKQVAGSTEIGKNELVNPRFESTDENKQPYTVTAERAIQGEEDEKLVILEKPVADMLLNSGNWIAAQADKGAYHQGTQKLMLEGHVKLFHDKGYQLETQKLQIDVTKSLAWSDNPVYGQGPAGTLEAKGLKADNNAGRLVFTGPAKLVLNSALKDLN